LNILRQPESPPPVHSIQLRVTAENVEADWSLSIGKIQSFSFPKGNGIRVDTHLVQNYPSIVSADFDSLLAKFIITASTWPDAVRKAERALEDTHIVGIKTNLDILRGIVSHPGFLAGRCDTQWLETHQHTLLKDGQAQSNTNSNNFLLNLPSHSSSTYSIPSISQTSTLFRKGDAWSITLEPPTTSNTSKVAQATPPHRLELTRVLRNEFPTRLTADITFTTSSTIPTANPISTPYIMTLKSTSASSAALTAQHRTGDTADPSHVVIPFPGKLVEVLVDEGDVIKEGDVVCVIQQMKMELEVRAETSGRVAWVLEAEDGEDVADGTLAAVVERGAGKGAAKL
jgi:acetyl/propionyl-CoA carboxylase alpha subunit